MMGGGWSSAGFRWHEVIPRLNRAGYTSSFLLSTYVGTDDRNSSWRAVFVDQPSLGLSREYLVKGFDDEDVQTYLTYMKSTARLLGAEEGRAEQEMTEVKQTP